MKFDIHNLNKYIVASDTDSLFITIEPIIKKNYPDIDLTNIEEVLPITKQYQQDIGDKLNKYQSVLAKNLLNSDNHFFDLKPEYIIKKAYWAGKRRYAQHLIDQEGIRKDDIVMMGLDIMKSNFPPYFREFGENILKSILFDKSKTDIDKDVITFKTSLSNISYNKLLKPTGVKKIEDYIERPPLAGEIFSKLLPRTPINSRSAIIYNDLLRFKKLNKKYPEFRIGDKMYIAYLKPNPYRLNVMGCNGYNDPPEIQEFIEKYIDRGIIFESIMKNKLESIYNDLGWKLNLNPIQSKFFNFN
jgi:hypothetical protein